MRSIKLIIVLTAAFLPLLSIAQTSPQKGIRFESGLSWTQVQAKAKAENKYIFMDCYATWCGPCKWMSVNIFPDREVGDFMNAHFINVAVQMDKTVKDDQGIKNWYGDANKLQQEYKIDAYPTYLFFSPDGQPLHRFTGLRGTVKEFLSEVNAVFDPTKQYYSITHQWESHKKDTAFLWSAYIKARRQRDNLLADSVGLTYLSLQSNLLTKRNLQIITNCNLIQSSTDKWFQLFLKNQVGINDSIGKATFVVNLLAPTIYKEEILPSYFEEKPLQWQTIQANLTNKYPSLGNNLTEVMQKDIKDHIEKEIDIIINKNKIVDWSLTSMVLKREYPDFDFVLLLLQKQTKYYADKKLWDNCADNAYLLMTKYRNRIDDWDMNNIVWEYVLMHANSSKNLLEAQKTMADIIKKTDAKYIYMDTYANLLFKIGRKNQAIEWEYKALECCIKEKGEYVDLEDMLSNLKKMQYGQPTWEN